MSSIDVIDLSHHQADVDFAEIRRAGVLGVILKATEGTSYVDPTFYDRRKQAKACGLNVASYHFFHGDPREMQHYVKTVQPSRGERLCIDHEDAKASLTSLVDAVQRLDAVQTSIEISIYSGHLIKDQLGNSRNEVLAKNTSLWLAQYTTGTPTWPKNTWPVWSLWQFSDQGQVPGVSGNCDLNAFNGSVENCLKWIGG